MFISLGLLLLGSVFGSCTSDPACPAGSSGSPCIISGDAGSRPDVPQLRDIPGRQADTAPIEDGFDLSDALADVQDSETPRFDAGDTAGETATHDTDIDATQDASSDVAEPPDADATEDVAIGGDTSATDGGLSDSDVTDAADGTSDGSHSDTHDATSDADGDALTTDTTQDADTQNDLASGDAGPDVGHALRPKPRRCQEHGAARQLYELTRPVVHRAV